MMTVGVSKMQEWFVVSWDTTRESYFVPAVHFAVIFLLCLYVVHMA